LCSSALAVAGLAALGCKRQKDNAPFVVVLSPGHGKNAAAVRQLESELTRQAGAAFELRTASSGDDAVRMATAAGTDGALLTIFEYLFARHIWKVEAELRVLRNGGKRAYHGDIVALRDGATKTVADLRGRTIAYVDRYSTTGFLLAAKLLKDQGVEAKPSFTGSHEAALAAVREGKAAAAATYADAVRVVPDLRSLAKTDPVSNEPLFVRADLEPARRRALTSAVLAAAATERGKQALAGIAGIEGFEPVTDQAYTQAFELVSRAGHAVQELVPRGWVLANEKARPPELTP
jgi:phosphonate transport system substrate-binding protein